jgi:hypothetical protein
MTVWVIFTKKVNAEMLLSELIQNIDKSKKNSSNPDIEHYANALGVITNSFFAQSDKLQVFWLWKRYDSDSYVGIEAIYLDDEFIGLNTTTGKNSGDGELEFVSKEASVKLREHILTLMHDEEENVAIINMSEEMGEGVPVSYSSELLTKKLFCTFKNETVNITQSWSGDKDYKKWSLVEVESELGVVEIRSLKEGLLVPYCEANQQYQI